MNDYKRRSDSLSKKEQDTLKDMKIVQEMYARGFEFLPLDIYRAKATKFQIIDGNLCRHFQALRVWETKRRMRLRWLQQTVHICQKMTSGSGRK